MKSEKTFSLWIVLLMVAIASLGPGITRAQTINGTFHGTITDSTGAVIPAATVSVRNLATDAGREVSANEAGFYKLIELPPAIYSITASKTGFERAVQPRVVLQVNQDVEVNFTLAVGAVTQQVEVTAAATALDTATATIGQVVNSRQVVDLPLNGRQFTQLILLTPGAEPIEGGQQSAYVISIGGGGVSPGINGEEPQQNNFTIDGVLNNALFLNIWAISPPPDAIEEFKVQSHMVDARFGISSGGNINLVTKSGGDQLHGDVWEFLRNSALDSTNYFTNAVNQPKPPYRMNQYGGTIGGPLVLPMYDGRKKKTFFFADYEGFRSRQSSTLQGSLPTAGELGGNFSDILTTTSVGTDPLGRPILQGQIYNPYSSRQVTAGAVDPVTGLTAVKTALVRDPYPGNVIPTSALTPISLDYIKAFYPLPNYGPGGNSFPNYYGPGLTSINQDQFEGKIDHVFANNDTLNGAFYYIQPHETLPTEMHYGAEVIQQQARTVAVGYTHLFSPTFLVNVHYGYTYSDDGFYYLPAGAALQTELNEQGFIPSKGGFTQVTSLTLSPRFTGTIQQQVPLGPIHGHEITGDFEKIAGNHTLGAGFMFYHIHSYDDGWHAGVTFDQYGTSAINGAGANLSTTGDGLASMLANVPSAITAWVGNTQADIRTLWQGYYLQDQWRILKKLTITAGIRYDFVAPPSWLNNQISGFDLKCACYLMSQPLPPLFPFANVRATYSDPQFDNFQPRFGFNYALTSKTVVRGAFAEFYDHNNSLVQEVQSIRMKWPWGISYSFGSYNRGVPNLFFTNLPAGTSFLPSASQNVGPSTGYSLDPRAPTPYSMEWNFGIERTVTPNLTASIDYSGSASRHLFEVPIANTPLPDQMGPNALTSGVGVPYPAYGQFDYSQNEGTGDYSALEIKVEQRTSHGLYFLGSYTWAHCLNIDDSGETTIMTIYNPGRDYGNCGFNMPQNFVFSGIYQLPFGRGEHFGSSWGRGVNGVFGGWQAAGIFTARSGTPLNIGISGDIANVNGGSQRASLVAGQSPLPSGFKQTVAEYYNAAAFAVPAAYTFGNLGKNILRGPDFQDLDFSLRKEFRLTESKHLEVRADAFNMPNQVRFGNPGATVNTTSTFMKITSASGPRDMQVSMKLVF